MGAVEHPHHGPAHRADHVRVRGEARHQQLHLLHEAGLRVLLDEVHPHGSRVEGVDRPGAGGPDLRDLRGVVQLSEPRVHLADHPPLVEPLEPGQGVPARGVVGGQDEGGLVVLQGRVVPHGLVQVVVLPRHVEEVQVALLPRVLGGARVGTDVEDPATEHQVSHRQEHVGEDDPRHQVHPVPAQEPFHRGTGHVRVQLVVRGQHLHGQAAQPPAQVTDGQLEGVQNVLPQCSPASRQGADEPDPERPGLAARHPRRQERARQHHHRADCPPAPHVSSPLSWVCPFSRKTAGRPGSPSPSGITAVASISTLAPGSTSPFTSTTDMAG
ncbi:hypothetical protein HRbin31_00872 [bacterium HR31]|nr:hypothetical protein HRbin31_00872 [bacterium HR31]